MDEKECAHLMIVNYCLEDGTPVRLWACARCKHKFAPLEIAKPVATIPAEVGRRAMEAMEPFSGLAVQADAYALANSTNVRCQLSVADMRRAAASIDELREVLALTSNDQQETS